MKTTFLQNKFIRKQIEKFAAAKTTLLQNKFIRKQTEKFAAINIGNYYIRGLIIEGGEAVSYFIERKGELSAVIKKLWDDKKIPVKKVKISIKTPSSLVRYFPFPKMEKKKLKQTLFYEINKFIPFPSEKVYYDFFILNEISPSEVSMLLAVAKKDFVDNILEIFERIGLKVTEINLDSICLINLFLNNYESNEKVNPCLLDIGYNFSTMTILNKDTPFLTRDVKFSTKEVLEIVSRIENKPLKEIEKQLFSPKSSDEFLKLTRDSISNFCQELKRSFDYFEMNKGEPINKLYLSGGLASIENIGNIFVEALDMETEILKPISEKGLKLSKAFSDKEFGNFENSFSAVFGLAL